MFDPVAELRLDVKELAAEDRAGWPAAAHTDRLSGLLEVRERFEVELVRTVAAWDGMGRRTRLFTRTQRRALVYRDRGCVFPGCDRPARFCDAHPWEHGGLTDLINGVLLCRRHHTLVHHGWDLTRDPISGIVTVTSPDGRTFTRHPARNHHPGRSTLPPPSARAPARC